ncbi:hypothetical protein DL98DRAFT_138084 [Cadophora sp. DSE1049]|nr:hypothetical protein DL98DRAFT_138084 [Cadophora sp. DSE1049]
MTEVTSLQEETIGIQDEQVEDNTAVPDTTNQDDANVTTLSSDDINVEENIEEMVRNIVEAILPEVSNNDTPAVNIDTVDLTAPVLHQFIHGTQHCDVGDRASKVAKDSAGTVSSDEMQIPPLQLIPPQEIRSRLREHIEDSKKKPNFGY